MNADTDSPEANQPPTGMAPAGWLADPQDPGKRRYWNGTDWTTHTAPSITSRDPSNEAVHVQWRSTNGYAIASLVCSVSGLVIPFVGSILGIVFGHVALSEIKNSNGRQSGRGLAKAGLFLGYLFLVLLILFVGIWIYILLTSDNPWGP